MIALHVAMKLIERVMMVQQHAISPYRRLLYSFLLLVILVACTDDPDPIPGAENPPPVENRARPTPVVDYDPGPYFTPNREAPTNPAAFVPAESLGAFTRTHLSGRCPHTNGLQSLYQNPNNNIVILYCYYMPTPLDTLNRLRGLLESGALQGEPIFFEIQGDASFTMGEAAPGVLYAWTHARWLFIAHSLSGRAALDDFMNEFSH